MTIGYVSYLLVGKESAYGTQATADKVLMPLEKVDYKSSDEMFKLRAVGLGRDVKESYSGKHSIELSLEGYLPTNTSELDVLLPMVFGSAEFTADGLAHAITGPEYAGGLDSTTTTIKEQENQLPSYTVEIGFGDYNGGEMALDVVGFKVDEAEFSISNNDMPIKVRVSGKGAKEVVGTYNSSAGLPGDIIYSQLDTTITLNLDSDEIVGNATDLTFSVKHNLEELETIGSRFYYNLKEKARDYSLSMTMYFEDPEQVKKFFDIPSTTAPVDKKKSPIPGITIKIQYDANKFIEFKFKNLYIENISNPVELDGITKVEWSGYVEGLEYVYWQ